MEIEMMTKTVLLPSPQQMETARMLILEQSKKMSILSHLVMTTKNQKKSQEQENQEKRYDEQSQGFY
jgi:uncharacterized membrane-anchored protein YhcB (DUF1043 family)